MNSQHYEQAVFISYAWGGESEEIVNQIDETLEKRGLTIIRDKRDLGYKGSINSFMERIGDGNCVIVVISDKYLRSPNCMFELAEIAEGKQFHDRVFPIVLSDANIYDPVKRLEYVKHWEGKLAELDKAMREVGQANLQGIREDIDQYSRIRDKVSGLTSILKDMNTLTPDLHRDSDFSEIYTGIERRIAETSGLHKSKPGESPYMGLRYFDTSDAELFYGRKTLTEELLRRVQNETFLAIVGASGSGKSSVARAGLIPSWKAATMGAIHVITPTAHPLESLAASLTRESESVTATSTLIGDLQKDARSLRLYVRKLLTASGEANLLLVVDQFEETFTLCKDHTERKAFIENLLSLAEEDGAARVVLTLRADFYHHCAEYEGLRNALKSHQEYIGAMTLDDLRDAVVQPAKRNGWDFEPGLVDLILGDVGTEPGALPLLSHALLETWKCRQGSMLTLQGYSKAGGVKKAIAQTAESVYDSFSPAEQAIARGIFLRLTELGEGTQDTRRRARLDELTRSTDHEMLEKVLKTLIDARLVTTEKDSVEVSHEALIREWGTLRKWLDEDRESLRLHRHLTESAGEWQRRGRETSELYRGTRLRRIQEWMKEHGDELSLLESEFVRASQSVKNREKVRWVGLSVVGVMLVLAAVLAQMGYFNRMIYRPLPIEWIAIPAGEFLMGSSTADVEKVWQICPSCDVTNEQPQHLVYLNMFEISKYEVTNTQYRQCVRAGACSKPTDNPFFEDEQYNEYPVVGINWESAQTFCRWNRGRLPTEAEWEKAARGPETDQNETRSYPWGNDWDATKANADNPDGGLQPIGTYTPNGDSVYGLADMSGNVWEWVMDWYGEYGKSDTPQHNPMGSSPGKYRIIRGGSFEDPLVEARSTYRLPYNPGFVSPGIGFRCAKDEE